MNYSKNLTQKYETDVFIVGGGAAGVAAAVACARQGKKVFLAESTGCFGGLGTSGMVPAFAPFDDGINVLADGIGMEIRKNVSKHKPLNSYWTVINAEELKREYDRIITQAGVEFSFFTTLYDVTVKGNQIENVILGSKSGLFTVKAKIYIDASGDGDLCYFGGGEYEMGDENGEVMPQTLCSLWINTDRSRVKYAPNHFVEQAYKDGVLSVEDRHIPGFFYDIKGIGRGNIGHTFGINPTDEVSLTKAMLEGRTADAAALQLKYLPLINALFCETNPIPVKAAMAEMGFCKEDIRLPLCEMSADKRAKMLEIMKEAGIKF